MLSPNEALDTPDAPKKMAGSLMIFEASTYAEVKAMIESDVYWTGNVVCALPCGIVNLSRLTRAAVGQGEDGDPSVGIPQVAVMTWKGWKKAYSNLLRMYYPILVCT